MTDDEFEPSLYRDNPGAIAAYVDDKFAKNDLSEVLLAINQVMKAQNVQAIARETELRRDLLYKTFGGKVDPRLGRVMALFSGLGVRLAVIPLKPKARAPRPTLGRPPKPKVAR